MREANDKSGPQFQRMTWDALRKSLNGLINKVNVQNIKEILPDIFREVQNSLPDPNSFPLQAACALHPHFRHTCTSHKLGMDTVTACGSSHLVLSQVCTAEFDQRARRVLPEPHEVTVSVPHLHTNLCSSHCYHQHKVPRDWRASAEEGYLPGRHAWQPTSPVSWRISMHAVLQ